MAYDSAFIDRETLITLGMREYLIPRVLPIMLHSSRDNTMVQYGTGTLLRIGEAHFLITAAHLFDLNASEVGLYISDYTPPKSNYVVPLGRIRVVRGKLPFDGGVFGDDPPILDVAVIPLGDDIIAQIPNRKWLNMGHIDTDGEDVAGRYLLCGYPTELTATNVAEQVVTYRLPMVYSTEIYQGPISTFRTYDKRFHFLLCVPIDGAVPIAGSTRPRANRIQGISGCSVWRTVGSSSDRTNWTPAEAKVVGVQSSEYSDRKVAKCIRWSVVLSIIWLFFPEIRELILLGQPHAHDRFESFKRDFCDLLTEHQIT